MTDLLHNPNGWENEAPESLPYLQRWQVYRVSHISTEYGIPIRLVHPCVIVTALDAPDAIERASSLGCWTLGHGHSKLPGAFLMAAPAWRDQATVKSTLQHGESFRDA